MTPVLLLSASLHLHAAGTITNVSPVNVTPTSFSILWRSANSTPSIAVFADAAGLTNVSSQLGIEAFPVHTGNPDLAPGYLRRQSQIALRAKTQSLGQMLVRVTGCQPGTTYYYQLTSTPPGSSPIVYPTSGPLPSVTTETENTFVVDSQQLILDVPGLDTAGRIVTLTHTNAAHPLASVVGDGVNTNQVFFNVSDLFALTKGQGNFSPMGAQTFTVDVMGPNQTDTFAEFTLTFSTNFTSGGGNQVTLGTEFLAITFGSTILQTGQTSSVPVGFNSSVGIANLDLTLNLAPGHLTNFVLTSLAPEVDPAAVGVTAQGLSNIVLHLPARSGQVLFGNKQVAQFSFTAITNQPSAFVPLKLQQISATKTGSSLLTSNLFGTSGRAVVVGREALLETALQPNGTRAMTLYGKPYSSYALEYATNLASPVIWTRLNPIAVTQLATPVTGVAGAPKAIFYRAVEFLADPPILQASQSPDQSRSLRLFGQPSSQYTVEYKTNLSNVVAWYPLVTATLTNSFGTVTVGATNPIVFYRLRKN